jgi:hypothetical protein
MVKSLEQRKKMILLLNTLLRAAVTKEIKMLSEYKESLADSASRLFHRHKTGDAQTCLDGGDQGLKRGLSFCIPIFDHDLRHTRIRRVVATNFL